MPSRPPTLDKLWIFKSHDIFGRLPVEVQSRLANQAVGRRYSRGTMIFSRGDPGTSLFSVVSGTVKLSVQSPGTKDAVFRVLKTGGVFGEIALLDGRSRSADAQAVTDCHLLVLERRDFVAVLHDNPDVALKIIELLCERLRLTSNQVEDLLFLTLEARLAKVLLGLMKGPKVAEKSGTLSITQRALGEIVGVSRESTNKQLREWQSRRWLTISRGHVTILKPQALEELAGQESA